MNTFITLTYQGPGPTGPVAVNVTQILIYAAGNHGSSVTMVGGTVLNVAETPSQIAAMIVA